jgi:hypothetical protein
MAKFNEFGVIAETYAELQSLPLLAQARANFPLPPASGASRLRAICQAVEVALLNLADLLAGAAEDVYAKTDGPACVKVSWALGFHRVLTRLSLLPAQLALHAASPSGVFHLCRSPGLGAYIAAVRCFDAAILKRISGNSLLHECLSAASLDDRVFRILHLARVGNHESTIWERNLAWVSFPVPIPSEDALIGAALLQQAVEQPSLSVDTFFRQFRGLHQIPEILANEMNDHVEQAIRQLRQRELEEAAEHLDAALQFLDAMLACLPPIIDNLALSDYHSLRENLGLTSGSHSVALHYHLFDNLYEQLAEALYKVRSSDNQSWLLSYIQMLCLRLGAALVQWRDWHLHLPRNNLGSGPTHSLAGSADAVRMVEGLRSSARERDPLRPLALERGIQVDEVDNERPLTQYLCSRESLDSHLLAVTGEITRRRFPDVQNRSGAFGQPCPFQPPPRREV